MNKAVKLTTVLLTTACLTACDPPQPSNKTEQARIAERAAQSIVFTENAEIDNIKRRLELTANPGLLGFVALINDVGQIALYTPVTGKITSGSKRLTKPWAGVGEIIGSKCANQQFTPKCDDIIDSPNDEGTWGSSNPYIYFWTPAGQYIQTSMSYIYSDKPFRLREEPLLLTLDTAPTK